MEQIPTTTQTQEAMTQIPVVKEEIRLGGVIAPMGQIQVMGLTQIIIRLLLTIQIKVTKPTRLALRMKWYQITAQATKPTLQTRRTVPKATLLQHQMSRVLIRLRMTPIPILRLTILS